jgi:hypothetical protein
VEIVDRREVMVHADTAEAVDRLLAGRPVGGERRKLVEGKVVSDGRAAPKAPAPKPSPPRQGPPRLYAHAISREVLAKVLDDMEIAARIVDDPERATLVLSLRARAGDRALREVAARGVEIQVVKKNSSPRCGGCCATSSRWCPGSRRIWYGGGDRGRARHRPGAGRSRAGLAGAAASGAAQGAAPAGLPPSPRGHQRRPRALPAPGHLSRRWCGTVTLFVTYVTYLTLPFL